jgi:hypothetical protein
MTNINNISTPVSTVSSQSLRSRRKRRRSLIGSRIILSYSKCEGSLDCFWAPAFAQDLSQIKDEMRGSTASARIAKSSATAREPIEHAGYISATSRDLRTIAIAKRSRSMHLDVRK